jgi:Hemerythrin HHE cation binding domain
MPVRPLSSAFIAAQLRAHNVIRLGLARVSELSAEKTHPVAAVKKYSWLWCQFLELHHDIEEAVIFPAIETKLSAEDPLHPIMQQFKGDHVELLKALEKINAADDFDSLHSGLSLVEKLILPHLELEEKNLTAEAWDANVTDDETKETFGKIGAKTQAGDPSIPLPFMWHHLSDGDRSGLLSQMPQRPPVEQFSEKYAEAWALCPFPKTELGSNL